MVFFRLSTSAVLTEISTRSGPGYFPVFPAPAAFDPLPAGSCLNWLMFDIIWSLLIFMTNLNFGGCFFIIACSCCLRPVIYRLDHLSLQHCGQTDTAMFRHRTCVFLVEHGTINFLAATAAGKLVLTHGIPHRFQHHPDKQGFELPGYLSDCPGFLLGSSLCRGFCRSVSSHQAGIGYNGICPDFQIHPYISYRQKTAET